MSQRSARADYAERRLAIRGSLVLGRLGPRQNRDSLEAAKRFGQHQEEHTRLMIDQSTYFGPSAASRAEHARTWERTLRQPEDLYNPRWTRGHRREREGFCSLCPEPGRWLLLRNSAFWYDKTFVHGISAATKKRFQGPERILFAGEVVWVCAGEGEQLLQLPYDLGQCSTCAEWVPLSHVENDAQGNLRFPGIRWFKHAAKVSMPASTPPRLRPLTASAQCQRAVSPSASELDIMVGQPGRDVMSRATTPDSEPRHREMRWPTVDASRCAR